MGHAYHPACGCSACCDEELADERRDEYIQDFAPAIAKKLIRGEDFAWDVITEVSQDAQRSILQDAGRFFTAVECTDDERLIAAAAVKFWRELRPYIEAAAQEQAEGEVAADYDRALAA